MRILKALVIAFYILVVLFITLDLLFSDFGPGETEQSRLEVILIFLVVSFFIPWILKKKIF